MWPFSEANAAAMCTQNQQRVTSALGYIAGSYPDAVAETQADHFGNCPVCGALLDMRDLGQVIEHVHDADLEIGARSVSRRRSGCIFAALEIPCCGAPRPSFSTTFQIWGRFSGSASSCWSEC